jgi:hypothetical protein
VFFVADRKIEEPYMPDGSPARPLIDMQIRTTSARRLTRSVCLD